VSDEGPEVGGRFEGEDVLVHYRLIKLHLNLDQQKFDLAADIGHVGAVLKHRLRP
jgi:hypothetical protein